MIISFVTPVFAEYGLTFEQILTTYVNVVLQKQKIPSSYNYIELKYPNISKQNSLYPILQKAVYLDIFPNANIELPLNKQITQQQVINIIAPSFSLDVFVDKKALVTVDWFTEVLLEIQTLLDTYSSSELMLEENDVTSNPLFLDVYQKLLTNYVSDT
ncbi:TPA: hypothetical protein DIC40_05075 [Patescibacteria group bacterium]|nr:hypothetical protein [Candidatus Gracilibacteria bacterium]